MKKKMIFITLGGGLVGFAGMFALAWFTKPEPPAPVPATAQAGTETPPGQTPAETDEASAAANRIAAMESRFEQPMTDRQLQSLIFEVREKIKEYNQKLRKLDVQEKRLQAAQENLKKDIEEMANLRVELASAVATLKQEQEKLLNTVIEIEANEKENLVSIAATYDKMDAQSAGKILMNMVKNSGQGNGTEDAVKILYYMTERTKAKVLASIAESEPAVSAYICQRLKRMITKE